MNEDTLQKRLVHMIETAGASYRHFRGSDAAIANIFLGRLEALQEILDLLTPTDP